MGGAHEMRSERTSRTFVAIFANSLNSLKNGDKNKCFLSETEAGIEIEAGREDALADC